MIMNRKIRRAIERAKPRGNRHDNARIPKIVLSDRDFSQIDILMMKLTKGEVETIDDQIVMTTMDGETYQVVAALEGWIDYWSGLAYKTNIPYDDSALISLKDKLANDINLTLDDINQAKKVVDIQRQMFFITPASVINSQIQTTQIKMLMERT